jgi:hypothetical protein
VRGPADLQVQGLAFLDDAVEQGVQDRGPLVED